jgi:hypothetical protein
MSHSSERSCLLECPGHVADWLLRFGNLFGCDNLTSSLPDTSAYYAQYTATVLCSRMIQDSKSDCGLSSSNSTPVCADTCVSGLRILFATALTIVRLNSRGANR